jgi:nicotinate-nucleotide pyrophosphorylase (carboxylating)
MACATPSASCVRLAILALDPTARFEALVSDGDAVDAGTVLARVDANARALLSAERTALNLLGRLSGIATLTSAYVDAVVGAGASITDTRKTTPGLRALEKYAVRCGGGVNHRFGLDDAILIKDNHVAACGGVRPAIERARAFAGHLVKVECEVDSLRQFDEALAAGPDVIMLDNMSTAMMREAVARVRAVAPATLVEASGGLSLGRVREVAETGVDLLSVGALTHSARGVDLSLEF